MPDPDDTETGSNLSLILPEKVYQFLKLLALVILPAISTLYFSLGEVWDWPNIMAVMGTIASIEVFLGALLGISTKVYNNSDEKFDGVINSFVAESGVKTYSLVLNNAPESIDAKSQLVFKVASN